VPGGFPLPALSPGERGARHPVLVEGGALDFGRPTSASASNAWGGSRSVPVRFPLLGERDRGEGERVSHFSFSPLAIFGGEMGRV
jgi:hypothetical protein